MVGNTSKEHPEATDSFRQAIFSDERQWVFEIRKTNIAGVAASSAAMQGGIIKAVAFIIPPCMAAELVAFIIPPCMAAELAATPAILVFLI